MKILVIGGTRFMGPHAIETLVHHGHEVAAFHRGQGQGNLTVDIQEYHGDRTRLPEYADELRAFAPKVVLDMMLLTEQHARDLVETFRGVARRIVAASSEDVYRAYGRLIGTEPGPPESIPADEDSPLRERMYPYRPAEPPPADAPRPWSYDYDKILVERVIMGQPDLPGTVLRLPMVYGPHDGQHRVFPYLKRMDDGRPAIVLSEGQAAFRSSRGYVENMGYGIALAVTDERAAGRIYNLAEPDALPEAQWVRRIGEAAGWNGEVVVVPSERLPESLREEEDFRHHLVVDTSRIRTDLGYTERVSAEEAIRRTVEWERVNPPQQLDPAQFDYDAEDSVLKGR